MNRKILLGIVILIGVVGIFFYFHSKKQKTRFNEDFSSKEQETFVASAKKETLKQQEIVKSEVRTPNAVETPKSGKYSVRISTPMVSIQDEIKKRDRYLNQNTTGLVLKSADQNYMLMKLRASKEKSKEAQDHVMGHEIYSIDAQTARLIIVDRDSYPVVYRESNGRMGFLTGVILIQTEDKIAADVLAQKYPIDLQIYDSAIQMASFKVREGEGLYNVYNHIRQNERVKSISIEVLDSYKGF